MSIEDPLDPQRIHEMASSQEVRDIAAQFINRTAPYKYVYNFKWLGRPVIQFPQDLIAIQEIVWNVQPAFIIETGVAHGGSLVFHASILELIGKGRVIGIEVELREHNRLALDAHPLGHRVELVEGSSLDANVVREVSRLVGGEGPVLVILDSNHTHEHVLEELRVYSRFVTRGSYLIVLDTIVEMMPEDAFPDRPWSRGNNPYTAVQQFLGETPRFEVDPLYPEKLLITSAPGGYLLCVEEQE